MSLLSENDVPEAVHDGISETTETFDAIEVASHVASPISTGPLPTAAESIETQPFRQVAAIVRRRRSPLMGPSVKATDLSRLARRGGVMRMSKSVASEAMLGLRDFLKITLKNSILMTESRQSKTVTQQDILEGLKRLGQGSRTV